VGGGKKNYISKAVKTCKTKVKTFRLALSTKRIKALKAELTENQNFHETLFSAALRLGRLQ
jgi:hypothetical protein